MPEEDDAEDKSPHNHALDMVLGEHPVMFSLVVSVPLNRGDGSVCHWPEPVVGEVCRLLAVAEVGEQVC